MADASSGVRVTLHKYTKAEHGLSYLRNGLLRFTPLREFNDPFEMRPYIDSMGTPEQWEAIERQLEEEDEGYRALTPEQKRAVRDQVRAEGPGVMQAQMETDLSATIGILCLVNNRHDDLLMWAHYADSHKGCVLEFDSTHAWFNTKQGRNPHELMGVLQDVKYEPSRPRVSILDLGRDHLLTKADCWRYEKEKRMILNLQDCKAGEVSGLFPIPHEALMNIYLGVEIDPVSRGRFLDALPSGHRVGLFQFRLHEQEFALVAQQIN